MIGRGAMRLFVPFMLAGAVVYLVWPPETLLINRVVTWITFAGLGGPTLALALLTLAAMNLMGLGSLLAIAGGLAFVVNIGWPLVRGAGRCTCSPPTSSR